MQTESKKYNNNDKKAAAYNMIRRGGCASILWVRGKEVSCIATRLLMPSSANACALTEGTKRKIENQLPAPVGKIYRHAPV